MRGSSPADDERLVCEYASASPLEVGAVVWPEGAMLTVIVKVTLAADARGTLSIATDPGPLTLDRVAPDGEILYPSDFAPYKPLVDVVVVGDDARTRAGAAVLACGPLTKTAADGGRVGAREGFGTHGDPSDPRTMKAWAEGRLDFASFQCAPPDQGIACLSLPFRVGYSRGAVEFLADLQFPEPEVALFRGRGWGAAEDVRLTLDTVCVAPSAKRVALLWRGAVGLLGNAVEGQFLAAGLGSLRGERAETIASWPRKALVFPSDCREPSPLAPLPHAGEGREIGDVSRAGEMPGAKGLFSDETSSFVTDPSPSLPFQRRASTGSARVEERRPPIDPRELATSEVEPAVAWQDATRSVRVPRSAPPEPAPQTVRDVEASTFDYANPPKPTARVKVVPVELLPADSPAEATLDAFPLERCARIAAMIACRPGDAEKILAKEKVSAEKWAEFDAHWNAEAGVAAKRGEVAPQRKYDEEYVGQIERERGAIEVAEWARLVVAKERGSVDEVVEELSLPKEGLVRVERVWLRKVSSDLVLGKAINRAATELRKQ